ncbi:hypothetical protein HMN09_01142500 [Mycena chlorophos]|uniref:Uncharacterized protein n=1 Tax=Mycena chlorophos TaxID=658473 RepID=A0A8H6S758_MYCCL|nr:hypothetical protein HMN09_01142500 [Mycena chlorophos]
MQSPRMSYDSSSSFDPFSADPASESYIPDDLDLESTESNGDVGTPPKWKQLFIPSRGRSTDNIPWTLPVRSPTKLKKRGGGSASPSPRTAAAPYSVAPMATGSPLKKRHISTHDVRVERTRRRLNSQATLRPGVLTATSLSDESSAESELELEWDIDDDWERLSTALEFDLEPLVLALPPPPSSSSPQPQPPRSPKLSMQVRNGSWSRFKRM